MNASEILSECHVMEDNSLESLDIVLNDKFSAINLKIFEGFNKLTTLRIQEGYFSIKHLESLSNLTHLKLCNHTGLKIDTKTKFNFDKLLTLELLTVLTGYCSEIYSLLAEAKSLKELTIHYPLKTYDILSKFLNNIPSTL